MGLFCSRVCPGSVTVNGTRYRVVRDLGEGGKLQKENFLFSLLFFSSMMIYTTAMKILTNQYSTHESCYQTKNSSFFIAR